MIFRSDCRQALILFLTSDSSRPSSSPITTCIILRSSGICPREQNEKRHEKYAQTTRTVSETVSPEYSGSSLGFLHRNTPPSPSTLCTAERAQTADLSARHAAAQPPRPST